MASTNPTPNQVYVSNSVPFGGFFINRWRNTGTQAVPAWTKISVDRVESFSPQASVKLDKRPDVDGGPNGFTMVSGDYEGSITIQAATDATPSPLPGDVFTTSVIFRDKAGAAIQQLVVLGAMTPAVDANYRRLTTMLLEGATRGLYFPAIASSRMHASVTLRAIGPQ